MFQPLKTKKRGGTRQIFFSEMAELPKVHKPWCSAIFFFGFIKADGGRFTGGIISIRTGREEVRRGCQHSL